MPIDKRELILLRMQAAIDEIPGVEIVYRNRGEIPDDKLPAAILLDGTERRIVGPENLGRNRPGMGRVAPSIMGLNPQVFFVLKPVPKVQAATLGPLMSDWRMKL